MTTFQHRGVEIGIREDAGDFFAVINRRFVYKTSLSSMRAAIDESLKGKREKVSEQEPVAWRYRYGDIGAWKYVDKIEDCNQAQPYEREPLYGHPWTPDESLNNASAPGERKPGEIAVTPNDTQESARVKSTATEQGSVSEERVRIPSGAPTDTEGLVKQLLEEVDYRGTHDRCTCLLREAAEALARLAEDAALLAQCRQFVTRDFRLLCLPSESDRECLNRCKAQLVEKIDAALARRDK